MNSDDCKPSDRYLPELFKNKDLFFFSEKFWIYSNIEWKVQRGPISPVPTCA